MGYSYGVFQMRSVEQLSETHRRDLTAAAQRHAVVTEARMAVADRGQGGPEAAPSERTVRARRPSQLLGQHLGHWLIRAGTRIGGASVQTS